jgi:hypothetical protein
MNGNLARYFTAVGFGRWPIWKAAVSGVVALSLAAGGAGAAVAAANTAPAAASEVPAVSVPEATAEPIPADASWLSEEWTVSGVEPAEARATDAQITMDLSTSQQRIGVDLYETNRVTGKKSAFTGGTATVTLTCVSLAEVENAENQYDSEASKEGAVTTWPVDAKTGSVLIEKLNPGKYTVSVTCTDASYVMPAAQKVTVKEKVSYKKTDTKAVTQTAATKQEDAQPTVTGGEAVTLAPTTTSTCRAYAVVTTDTAYLWKSGDSYYFYYANGAQSPYKAELGKASNASGAAVYILKSAVYDAAMAQTLAAASASTAASSGAAAAAGTAARHSGLTLTALDARTVSGGIRLLSGTTAQTTEASPTPAPETSPTPAPTEAPAATATPAPTEAPTETPTATPAPTETPAATATPSATTTPTPTATATPTPTATPVPSFTLFDDTNKGVVENSAAAALLKLPAVSTVTLEGSNADLSGKVMGIDVSYHQGSIDWAAVKASGVEYVIIRMGYRGYVSGTIVKDPMFDTYMKGAKAAGLRVGVYFFSQAITEQEAVDEASACTERRGRIRAGLSDLFRQRVFHQQAHRPRRRPFAHGPHGHCRGVLRNGAQLRLPRGRVRLGELVQQSAQLCGGFRLHGLERALRRVRQRHQLPHLAVYQQRHVCPASRTRVDLDISYMG